MRNQSTHANQISMLATGRRRRLGAWLLAGWVAFWLTTVLQPCCSSFAAKSGSDAPTSVAHAAGPMTHLAEPLLFPEHPDTDCPDLSAVGPGAPNAMTGATGLNLLTAAPALGNLALRGGAGAFLASYFPHSTQPSTLLYLRTQRIRI